MPAAKRPLRPASRFRPGCGRRSRGRSGAAVDIDGVGVIAATDAAGLVRGARHHGAVASGAPRQPTGSPGSPCSSACISAEKARWRSRSSRFAPSPLPSTPADATCPAGGRVRHRPVCGGPGFAGAGGERQGGQRRDAASSLASGFAPNDSSPGMSRATPRGSTCRADEAKHGSSSSADFGSRCPPGFAYAAGSTSSARNPPIGAVPSVSAPP